MITKKPPVDSDRPIKRTKMKALFEKGAFIYISRKVSDWFFAGVRWEEQTTAHSPK